MRAKKLLILIISLCFIMAGSSVVFGKRAARSNFHAEVITTSGAWCWFADPRAVYSARHSKTFVGWVDTIGSITVTSISHKNGRKITANIAPKFQRDDHSNPALYITPGGRIVAFWSAHTGSDMFYRVTKRSGNVSSWGKIHRVGVNISKKGKLGYTYPNPQYLRNENKLYLFWRGKDGKPAFSTTSNLKRWSHPKSLIKGGGPGRPYVKVESNGRDTIHFAFTEGHPDEQLTSVYYFYYKGGNFHKADGTVIGNLENLPIPLESADKIYDATANGGVGAWVHDIAIGSKSQRPVIAYATFPSSTDHRYNYAKWTGSAWFSKEMVSAGKSFNPPPLEQEYSGGITLDHENPSVVYLSRAVKGSFQIEKWRTKNGGASWLSKRITYAKGKNVRPISPRGLKSPNYSVIWMRGAYNHFKKYRTSLVAIKAGKSGNKAPIAMFRATSLRGKAPFTVRFNAKYSKDLDGRIVKWRWDFKDRTPILIGTTSKTQHTFKKRGTFFVALDVIDNKGKKDRYIMDVTVR